MRREDTTMNFDDTPQEAGFRAEAAASGSSAALVESAQAP